MAQPRLPWITGDHVRFGHQNAAGAQWADPSCFPPEPTGMVRLIEGQTDTTVAIISLVVAGVTALAAVGATLYVARRQLAGDRHLKDLDEARDLVDSAHDGLFRVRSVLIAAYQFGGTYPRTLDATEVVEADAISLKLIEAGQALGILRYRLEVRLPEAHPVTQAFIAAGDLALRIIDVLPTRGEDVRERRILPGVEREQFEEALDLFKRTAQKHYGTLI